MSPVIMFRTHPARQVCPILLMHAPVLPSCVLLTHSWCPEQADAAAPAAHMPTANGFG